MILLYSQQISSRLEYVVKTILNENVLLTKDLEQYQQFEGLKINYSNKKIDSFELHIKPFGLLEESDIREFIPTCISWYNLTAFCMIEDADISFDIFSASFYLLSRYEEYLPHKIDQYGRYHHRNSLAFQHHFLDIPIINLWWIELNKIWKKKLQTTESLLKNTSFKYIPTYDVDIAYQCKGKRLHLNLLSLLFSFFKFNKIEIKNKWQYVWKKNDAFDTFSWLDTLHKKHHLHPVYFLLTLLEKGKYDKNYLASSVTLQNLYQQLAENYTTGIHPSWQSGDKEELLEAEMECLQSITNQGITLSRFHFLRFTLPDYYDKLIRLGIKEDFSMCYGSKNGFRASFANPFYWYDLKNNTVTDLLIHPFSFMDSTAHFCERKTAEQALSEMIEQYDLVKSVHGEFITLFHNHFLVDDKNWRSWRNMYKTFINKKYSY